MATEFNYSVAELEALLTKSYGLLLDLSITAKLLGYPSLAALRQSIHRGTSPVPVLRLPGRRSYYCRTRDLARYLAELRCDMISTGGAHGNGVR